MTTAIYDEYLVRVNALVARIAAEERESILRAAVAVADRVADDRLINVIGPGGHSSMGAEEVFYRAGGLACVNAILDDGFLLANGALRSMAVERTGYPTQKPLALLERLIVALCPPGGVVGDFFCGSGTTLMAAKKLGRHYVGCDVNAKAVAIAQGRLAPR